MARRLFGSASHTLTSESNVVSGVSFVMSIWFYTESNSGNEGLIWLGDKDVAAHFWVLDKGSANVARAGAAAGASQTNALTTGVGIKKRQWHHALAAHITATLRIVYLDGGSIGKNTTSRAPANHDRVAIGRYADSTPDQFLTGCVAQAAVWSFAGLTTSLEPSEIKALANGMSPWLVRRERLVRWWPMSGKYSDFEHDLSGNNAHLTVVGTQPEEDPPAFRPKRKTYGFVAAAPGAGQPTMRRWGGVPHMVPGPQRAGRSW